MPGRAVRKSRARSGAAPRRRREGRMDGFKEGSIFVCYRREDSITAAGRIYDHLIQRFGEPTVFKDVYDLRPGTDFGQALRLELARALVAVVLIGDRWLCAASKDGARRIDQPPHLAG